MNEQKLSAWWELVRAQADLEIARANQLLLADVIGELKAKQMASAEAEEPARARFRAAWARLLALGVPEGMLADMRRAFEGHRPPPWLEPSPPSTAGGNGEVAAHVSDRHA